MSAAKNAKAAVDAATKELADAQERTRAARKRQREAEAAHECLTARSTEAEVRSTKLDLEVATEMAALAEKAERRAESVLDQARRDVRSAEAADIADEQRAKGIIPILDIQKKIDPLLAQVDALRAEQEQLFASEVARRNPYPGTRAAAEQATYSSVADLVFRARGGVVTVPVHPLAAGEQAANRAYAQQARAREDANAAIVPGLPPPDDRLTDAERRRLLFCATHRPEFVTGDLELRVGLDRETLMAIAGVDLRARKPRGADPATDCDTIAAIRKGLGRAVKLAEASSKTTFNAASFDPKKKDWAPMGTTGKAAP